MVDGAQAVQTDAENADRSGVCVRGQSQSKVLNECTPAPKPSGIVLSANVFHSQLNPLPAATSKARNSETV